MRALVLGAAGAVGRVVAAELESAGHTVTGAGRRNAAVRIDLGHPAGLGVLAEQARAHDVVVNASGVEDPELVRAAGRTAFVELSATAPALLELGRAAAPGQSVLIGAGLAPGLTTMLVHALPTLPGDEVDVGIALGTGEEHGPAAVAWTAGLVGTEIFSPPERVPVMNLRERRVLPTPDGPRTFLRADFPDHALLGEPSGLTVRSYLATGGRATTAALGLVARAPRSAPLLARAPHWGSAAWSLVAVNRRTGASCSAQGVGQSRATGVLTALATAALVAGAPGRAVTMAQLLPLAAIPDLRGGPGSAEEIDHISQPPRERGWAG